MSTKMQTIKIGRFEFIGPFQSTNPLEDRSGVYAILCPTRTSNWNLVDVGESAQVKTRVDNHDRKDCWQINCNTTLSVAVLYTPGLQQTGRRKIEQEIRNQFNRLCGER